MKVTLKDGVPVAFVVEANEANKVLMDYVLQKLSCGYGVTEVNSMEFICDRDGELVCLSGVISKAPVVEEIEL